MKNLFKSLLAGVLALVCVFSFTACKTKISDTTADDSMTVYLNTQTNGGATAYYDGYLYFINGTATNDGTKLTKVKTGAICRVKIDETGEIDADTYEIVIDSLVGYDYGAIHIFGNFLYYTTPNSAVNYQDTVLYNQTKFMRYDLVYGKSYNIYTTKQNSSDETLSYAYYVVGDELDLVVYEKTNATITSIKIGKKFTTNYVIEDVTGCVLSETYGKCVTAGVTVDANNFVFYTTTYSDTDAVKSTKVYRTSPNTDNSTRIYDESATISILSIRNGKLCYSLVNTATSDSVVYAKSINGTNDVLDQNANVMTYYSYTNIIFYSGSNSQITALVQDDTSFELSFLVADGVNSLNISSEFVNSFDASVTFVGLVTLQEAVEDTDLPEDTDSSNTGGEDTDTNGDEGTNNDDANNSEETGDASDGEGETSGAESAETKYDTVTYLIYIDSDNIMYKIEVMRNDEITTYSDSVKLSKLEVSAPENYLSPEIIGNYIYFFANEVDEDDEKTGYIYLYRADLTITENADDYSNIVAISESN